MCMSLKMFYQEKSQLPHSQAHIVFFKEKNPQTIERHTLKENALMMFMAFFKISNCIVELPRRYLHVSSIKGSTTCTQSLTDILEI